MILFIALGLGLLAIGYVAFPLFRSQAPLEAEALGEGTPYGLTSRKDSVLYALQDLEFEREVGSLSEADYRTLDQRYRARAISILKEMDENIGDESLEADIERRVKSLRRSSAKEPMEETIERQVAALRQHPQEKGKPCPRCGQSTGVGDRFCRHCGQNLAFLCPHCGQEQDMTSRFCTQCGESLEVEP
ncbi:MAG: zinc ribbon domain-containing protein [Chloroflexi bacterium]|nr:zinc ribbon domain-containing protein [Chloroflexota bacterium]